MSDVKISVSDLTLTYGKKKILENVSFDICSGEIVAIVGANGCGKSTLIQALAGAKKVKTGSITYYGKDATKERNVFANLCGYVPQSNPIMDELSVKDNLKMWEIIKGKDKEPMIDYFNLSEILSDKVSTLSGGMKRRVSLACTLMGWPPILLLDEPTTALDFFYKDSIKKLLLEQKSRGGIVLITTHEKSEISCCDRILFINNKKLKELMNMEELENEFKENYRL